MSDIPALSAASAVPTTGISTDTSRLGSRANLEKAGKQFESVFVGMMLKSMRQAHLSSELFESKGLDTFREMQDQKVAQSMADTAPLGIGKAMVDFLSKAQAAAEQAAADSAPKTDTPPSEAPTP
ncbi:rod-binding protein [Sphingomonas hylomeconis]|uniref:Rod-binding protein n=1 Tax=Sphingomonas hylomeconis TaxID=1395958 RepID=A0ABV7SPM8_9SPHN|nr:rod-binding protein [Sphingomonas hylomeconis]